jgi:amidase
MNGKDRSAATVSRRRFLGTGLLGGALASVASPLVAWEESATAQAAAPTSSGQTGAAGTHAEVVETTITDLQAAMAAGSQTSHGLVAAYLERIAAMDRLGPELGALLEVNPEAEAIAEALDVERRERGPRGPLHGIPILLKDNIGTHDRMTTTAGSWALQGSVPQRDAFVVARLRAA